ncbi:MAG: two-component sensor histidine kinase [Gammaproteobacteria bacterium]|nr:two-component sensor histidine kinase [Gammaproteobacteria bacterium]
MVTLAFVLLALAMGRIAYDVTHEALERQLDHRIAAETAALLVEARDGGRAGIAQAVQRRLASRATASLDYLLVDDAGRTLAGNLQARVPPVGYEEFLLYHTAQDGRDRIAQALTTRVDGGMLVVAADRADLYEIDRTLTTLIFTVTTLMLLAGVTGAILIGWVTRRRLARIDSTAQAIIAGDLSRRIRRDGSDSEFDRLAGTLNEMLNRIATLMDNVRQVSTDIAHDLRTPLTRLSHQLERASNATGPEDSQAQLAAARTEAANLLDLFAALLRIAEVEGMSERLARARLDFTALVLQMADTYRPAMEEDGRLFQVDVQHGVEVEGDKRLLSQMIANLLDNALRHTPNETAVSLTLQATAADAILIVADKGPGVGAEEAPHLFQRFTRTERSRSTPGHGLGLAMVATVASAHGGAARISCLQPFAVCISLPRSARREIARKVPDNL